MFSLAHVRARLCLLCRTVHLGWVNVEFLRSSRIVPKLCRELPLIKLIMPPKGISMIHSYGEAIECYDILSYHLGYEKIAFSYGADWYCERH